MSTATVRQKLPWVEKYFWDLVWHMVPPNLKGGEGAFILCKGCKKSVATYNYGHCDFSQEYISPLGGVWEDIGRCRNGICFDEDPDKIAVAITASDGGHFFVQCSTWDFMMYYDTPQKLKDDGKLPINVDKGVMEPPLNYIASKELRDQLWNAKVALPSK